MDTYLIFFLAIFALQITVYIINHNIPIVVEGMKSMYNYGEPGSNDNTSVEMIKTYNVKYPKRPSLTGIYTDTGPLGANIGCYDSQTQGCNCISNSNN